ncbi:MAG TPA: flagellar biosynthesis anti-sigma factor FlgM [Acidobacteriaceae bacterium]|nr:flagellar biosynthesis anti-sigma factor FlgM [Acidobacteriaceae bacterium]
MTYNTGLMPSHTPLGNDNAVSDSSAVGGATRTQGIGRNSATSGNSAIDSIASDSAKVSLAGAMLSQATSGSDVRFERVAALQQSIAAGTYNVSASDVASKLVDALLK